MRVSRFYLPRPLCEGARLSLDAEQGHYLQNVLRLRAGATLTVFNGEGGEFAAKVIEAHRAGVVLELAEPRARDAESPLRVTLGLGISRGERMDLAVQKAVELGVYRIRPLFTEHCVVRLEDNKRQQRQTHWQKIAISACEQCGRNRVPEVDEPLDLVDWLPGQTGLRLFLDPRAEASLATLPKPDGEVTVLSGPEGGFADRERDMALKLGFTGVRLGPRILRTETAVLAALTAVQVVWGDLG